MKIEVGEYVRTRAGHFYKVTKIDKNGLVYWNKIQCGWSIEQLKNIVIKHSKNIIDLIEKGDYVNGHIVIDIDRNEDNELFLITEDYMDFEGTNCIYDNEIKSIVTKEQMASIEYKLEEDK